MILLFHGYLDVVGGLSTQRIYTKRMVFLKYLKIFYLNNISTSKFLDIE